MNTGKLLIITYKQKTLVLLIRDNRLISVRVYEEDSSSTVGNIYVGRVQSIAENINAAFVEIDKNTPCFLPLSHVVQPHVLNRTYDDKLKAGDELIVQVLRDAVKTKQPVLTTKISIPGTYLVLSDGFEQLGMSGKLSDYNKKRITDFLLTEGMIDHNKRCASMNHMGMVVRTNAGTLSEDMSPLLEEWNFLKEELESLITGASHRTCFSCLRCNKKGYIDDLKNYYTSEFDEIITDCADIYYELQDYYEGQIKTPPIRYYQDEYPLEKLYSIQTLLDRALNSRVWLKSGGYLIIEPTEALTVIDVNTGKFEAGKDREETFYHINMEAAKEIALQLKLRNISGIIIVDFINMDTAEHNKALLDKLAALVKEDSVKTTVVDMTPLGLVEITRKRISKPLREL